MRSFADYVVRSPKETPLLGIHALLDWQKVSRKLKRLLLSSNVGRPSYDPLKMFKILLLQRLYDLSDPEMEHQLYDRLSFREFCGFDLMEALPDETTICRFRNSLTQKSEALFNLVLDQLDAQGLLLRKGTLVDATIIPSHTKTPALPEQNTSDPEAGWTKKNDTYTYGYKAHVGVDEGSGLVVKAKTTSADYHDSQVLHHVVTGEEKAVYADKAYDSTKIRDLLKEANVPSRILRRKPKGKPMRWIHKTLNRLYSRVRCGVERVFAHFKIVHGYTQTRYRGWEKNQNHLHLLCITYNLKRATALLKKRLLQENCA